MLIFVLALYFVRDLPESFRLKADLAEMPKPSSAPFGAEVDPGKWTLQV
jgi:hypothetical protein